MSGDLPAVVRAAFEQWTGVVLPPAQLDAALSALQTLAAHRGVEARACLDTMARDRSLRQELIDSINLACAVRRGITDIATHDTDFLHVPNLKIWRPTDI